RAEGVGDPASGPHRRGGGRVHGDVGRARVPAGEGGGGGGGRDVPPRRPSVRPGLRRSAPGRRRQAQTRPETGAQDLAPGRSSPLIVPRHPRGCLTPRSVSGSGPSLETAWRALVTTREGRGHTGAGKRGPRRAPTGPPPIETCVSRPSVGPRSSFVPARGRFLAPIPSNEGCCPGARKEPARRSQIASWSEQDCQPQ